METRHVVLGGSVLALVAWLSQKAKKAASKAASKVKPKTEEPARDFPGAPPDAPEPAPAGPGAGSDADGRPKPIAVGTPDDPEIAALLAELDNYMRSVGVDVEKFSARELTRLPKTPRKVSAIPPRNLWSNMATTILQIAQPLRYELNLPFAIRAYRPPDYNDAVSDAPKSKHIWFGAIDIYLTGSGNTSENRRRLALAAARIFRDRGDAYKMGFGAYGYPAPSNIHVDTGRRRATTWRESTKYLRDLAQA